MIEIRDDPKWNLEHRIAHPGTFNANPLSAAAGATMLGAVRTGKHHKHADALNQRLVRELNRVLERAGVGGAVYGLASYFHITLGKEAPRPSEGIEWADGAPPPRMTGAVSMALRRAMLNHGVDLMGGAGGFTSGVHAEADIDLTVEAFEASVLELRSEGVV
jgi:glutamate-1-semialdehyde 2,1-aminomutase